MKISENLLLSNLNPPSVHAEPNPPVLEPKFPILPTIQAFLTKGLIFGKNDSFGEF